MMSNLFSIFDPANNYILSLNWLSTMLFILFIPLNFWMTPSRLSLSYEFISTFIFKEFKNIIPYSFSNIIIFYSTFMFILFNNFLGLFPYVFTSSSHLSFSLAISLTLWMSIMSYSLANFFSETLAHLTPLGTPSVLMPFMVLIESISLIIRPFTLAIRLSANMIAGHLLLSLLGSTGEVISSTLILMIMLSSQILLFALEISVSIIQSYVFSILAVLYSSEC